MTVISLSPATAYATKPNIVVPPTSGLIATVQAAAFARVNDALRGGANAAWTVDSGDEPTLIQGTG